MPQQPIDERVVFITTPQIHVFQPGSREDLLGKAYVWRQGHYEADKDGSNTPFYLQPSGLWDTRRDTGIFVNAAEASTALKTASTKRAIARKK